MCTRKRQKGSIIINKLGSFRPDSSCEIYVKGTCDFDHVSMVKLAHLMHTPDGVGTGSQHYNKCMWNCVPIVTLRCT